MSFALPQAPTWDYPAVALEGDIPLVDFYRSAASSQTLGPVVPSATGKVAVHAAASITLGAITAGGAGTVDVTATGSVTLGPIVPSATGNVAIKAASNVTLDDITATGTGTVVTPGAPAPDSLFIEAAAILTGSSAALALQGEGIGQADVSALTGETEAAVKGGSRS